MKSLRQISQIEDLDHRFRQMCELFSELVGQEGARARPYHSPDRLEFSLLPSDQKAQVLSQIGLALECFEEMRAEGQSLRDSPKLLWRSLRKLGLVPRPDIFDKMGDSDVVNVYSTDQRLIFQNLQFFDFVSLTLDELYSSHWYRFTRREKWAEEALMKYALPLLTGEKDETIALDIPEHVFDEVDTEELLKVSILVTYMSPIKSDGRVAGAIVLNKCRIVGKG